MGDLDKKRPLTGYVFTLCNDIVSWKASLLNVVTLSTTEVEYMAITQAVNEAQWVRG